MLVGPQPTFLCKLVAKPNTAIRSSFHLHHNNQYHSQFNRIFWCCGGTMNLGFLGDIPWVKPRSNQDSATHLVQTTVFTSQAKHESSGIDPKFASDSATHLVQTNVFTSQAQQESPGIDPKLSGWPLSFLSLFPWANNAGIKFQRPTTINKELKRHAQNRDNVAGKDNMATPLRFRPYVCKVPWHTGVRAFFSQLFPRYGHYCGPNWSSGKDGGSLVWDKRPIDWLDYCCYCHDIGYDTHDQAKLLKADLAFLECLENRHIMRTKGDPNVALLYKTMCINGLKNFLIPYRTNLVSLQQSGRSLIQFGWLSNLRWRSWNYQKE